jgi:hypothetical protein
MRALYDGYSPEEGDDEFLKDAFPDPGLNDLPSEVKRVAARVTIYATKEKMEQDDPQKLAHRYLIEWEQPESLKEKRVDAFQWEGREVYKQLRKDAAEVGQKIDRPKNWGDYWIIKEIGRTNLPSAYVTFPGLAEFLEDYAYTPAQAQQYEQNYDHLYGEETQALWHAKAVKDLEDAKAAAAAAAKATVVVDDLGMESMGLEDNEMKDSGGVQPMDLEDNEQGNFNEEKGDDVMNVEGEEGKSNAEERPENELVAFGVLVAATPNGKRKVDHVASLQDVDGTPELAKSGRSSAKRNDRWKSNLNSIDNQRRAMVEELSTLYEKIELAIRAQVQQRMQTWAVHKGILNLTCNLRYEFTPPLIAVQESMGFPETTKKLIVDVTMQLVKTLEPLNAFFYKCGKVEVPANQLQNFDSQRVNFTQCLKQVSSLLSRHREDILAFSPPMVGIEIETGGLQLQQPAPPAVSIVSERLGVSEEGVPSRNGGLGKKLVDAIQTSVIRYLLLRDAERQKHPGGAIDLQVRSNYAMDPKRALSILVKMVAILEVCPLASFFDFSTTRGSGSDGVDYVVIKWNVPKVSNCYLEDLLSKGQKSLTMVLEYFRIAQAPLSQSKAAGKDQHLVDAAPGMTVSAPVLEGIASKSNRKAKTGQVVAPATLYKPLACFINFLRYISFGVDGGGYLPVAVVSRLTIALRHLEASGKILLKRAELLRNSFRNTMMETQAQSLYEMLLRLKTVVAESGPRLLEPLVVYLFQGMTEWGNDGSCVSLAARREQLFGGGAFPQKGKLLLSQLQGILVAGISYLYGGHRPQVFRELVLLPPCSTLNELDLSLVADKLVSGLVCIQGNFYLVISKDKVASSRGVEKFQLPACLKLVCSLLFQWREYFLDHLLRVQDVQVQLKDSEGNLIPDSAWPILALPVFVFKTQRGKKKAKAGGSVVSVYENLKKNAVVFKDFQDVMEYGICEAEYFMPSLLRPEEETEETADALEECLQRPYQFELQSFCASFTDMRVALSNFQGIHLKANPILFKEVVGLVRHQPQIVENTYAPGVVNLQHQETAKRYAATMGFGAEQWDKPDFDEQPFRLALSKSVPMIPTDILFAARQLMYREVHNFFEKVGDGDIVLSHTLAGPLNDFNAEPGYLISKAKNLVSIIEDVADTYSLWQEENARGGGCDTGLTNFPYFLTLGKVPCILDQLWPMIPICSCCRLPVKLGSTLEDERNCWGDSFSGSLDENRYALAKALTLSTDPNGQSKFKFMFCSQKLSCENYKHQKCGCGQNIAFLLEMKRVLPSQVPTKLLEQINEEIYQ